MKSLALKLTAFGAIAVLASPALAANPWSNFGYGNSHSSHGFGNTSLYNTARHQAFQHRQIHHDLHHQSQSFWRGQPGLSSVHRHSAHSTLWNQTYRHSSRGFGSPSCNTRYGSGISFGNYGYGSGFSFRIGF